MIKVGKKTHNYDLIDYAIEGEEGSGGESAIVGDVTMMLGESSKARNLAEIVLEAGENATGDGDAWNDDFGWLKDDVADLRSELEGREIELFFRTESYQKENDDGTEETVSYDQATVIDAKTDGVITEPGQDSSESSETASTDTPDDFPESGETVLDIFVKNADEDGVPDRTEVETMLDTQVEDVSESDIDYVIDAVESELNGKVAA